MMRRFEYGLRFTAVRQPAVLSRHGIYTIFSWRRDRHRRDDVNDAYPYICL